MDVASSERSGKRPSRSNLPARPRRKPTASQPAAAETTALKPTTTPARNVGSLEAAFSLTLGVLLVITALFPKTIKQLAMLGIGGGLAYRGLKGHCGLYQATGIDTTKASLLKQLGDRI